MVDQAYQAALAQYDIELAQGLEDPENKPARVASWVVVTRREYSKETEEVKLMVEKAVEEDTEMKRLSEEPILPTDDKNQRLLKLDA